MMRNGDHVAARDAPRTGGRPAYILWFVWIVWLPFLAQPISELLATHPAPLRLIGGLGGAALFTATYLWATWRAAHSLVDPPLPDTTSRRDNAWLFLIALVVLSFIMVRGYGKDWGALFIFTSAYTGGALSTTQSARVIAALALIVAVGLRVEGASWPYLAQAVFLVAVVGLTMVGAAWSTRTSSELRMAREEIARLAVSEERLRFARDLHDLLGHSLSLIALKSELAGRLAAAAPERAVAEMHDVESVARQALLEVRQAVAGYRQPTLESELRGAQEILAAAGIDYHYEGASVAVPAAAEAALSWAVREGVTNVIKHSRARHCVIRMTQDASAVGLEVLDDGRSAAPGTGSGLPGLAERVAALGGNCEARPRDGGGFRLAVTIPMARGATTAGNTALGDGEPVSAGAQR